MKAAHIRFLTFALFTAIIAGAFVLNAFIPAIPGFAYAAVSIILGFLVFLAIGRIVKRDGIVLSDERTAANLAGAALDTYRLSYVGMMAFVIVVFNLPAAGAEWTGAARGVLLVMVAQAWLLLGFQALRNRRR